MTLWLVLPGFKRLMPSVFSLKDLVVTEISQRAEMTEGHSAGQCQNWAENLLLASQGWLLTRALHRASLQWCI